MTTENPENCTETAQKPENAPRGKLSKDHQEYWKRRLVVRTYTYRGKTVQIPDLQVRITHKGRIEWFNLQTTNRAVAAIKARDIYLSLKGADWDATLARFKPGPTTTPDACTVGDFLSDVAARGHLKPMTLRRYAVKLRKIVSDIAELERGLKAADRRAKYDYVNGGNKAWLAKVDAQPINLLTPDAITAWRNSFVAKAGSDGFKRKAAERSAASYLRCVRSLFSSDITDVLKVKLPPNPFEGVKFKDPGPQRYHSSVKPEFLLACADRELRKQEPQTYLALLLCLFAGLRRKEADLLTWEQIDLPHHRLQVRRTKYFEPKTEESERVIDLSDDVVGVLRTFKKASTTEFVLEGAEPDPAATYDYYRCDCIWRELNDWLRGKGVRDRKAIHSLRKESGSLVAAAEGIEAARHHLGHRDIRTTSFHYTTKKKRVIVDLPLAKAGELKAI